MDLQAGKLYIVPTPVGNLADFSDRAKQTLSQADFIACEDTRVGGKLCFLTGIKKPLVRYDEHNKKQSGEAIIERISKGENAALITDAGTPAVSDPGEDLVRKCHENGITVVPVAGPCAAVIALSASGIPAERFCFEGFLPENKTERHNRLKSLSREKRAMVFYLPPHDLKTALGDLFLAFGNRNAALCKELTKRNEKITRSDLESLVYETENAERIKGEYVLVTEGYRVKEEDEFWYTMAPSQHVEHYVNLGLSKMEAIKKTALDRGVPKNDIYKAYNVEKS